MPQNEESLIVQPPFRARLEVAKEPFELLVRPVLDGVVETGARSVDEILTNGAWLKEHGGIERNGVVMLEIPESVSGFAKPIAAMRILQQALQRLEVGHQLTYANPTGVDRARLTTNGYRPRYPNEPGEPYTVKATLGVPTSKLRELEAQGKGGELFNGQNLSTRIEMSVAGRRRECPMIEPVRNHPYSLDVAAAAAAAAAATVPPGDINLDAWCARLRARQLSQAVPEGIAGQAIVTRVRAKI
ncbi:MULTISPECIES: hypothetical protein [unclassified Thioalkalivibrio]|uniref:hypothetical protein n=1 Tax=unclassified Thioalkalivibrio TaxID=2621013 RepID=UPI0003748237|nr:MULTISPECIES: hypothetical protein [unclassified Thioalkalivibrio]